MKPWPWMPAGAGGRATRRTALEPDDCELVRALRAHEAWAFTATWNRYAALVYRVIDRALGPVAERQDLTQNVFLALFLGLRRLREPSALRGFIYSSAVRHVRAHIRNKRLHQRAVFFFDPHALPEVAVRCADHENREILDRLYRILDALPAEEHGAFVLRHIEGLTLEEIAQATATSLATAKRRLQRASERIHRLASADLDLCRYLLRRRFVLKDE